MTGGSATLAAIAKLALSGTLISTWWWFEPLQAASQVAAALAAIVGLAIGVITLWRMIKTRKRND